MCVVRAKGGRLVGMGLEVMLAGAGVTMTGARGVVFGGGNRH